MHIICTYTYTYTYTFTFTYTYKCVSIYIYMYIYIYRFQHLDYIYIIIIGFTPTLSRCHHPTSPRLPPTVLPAPSEPCSATMCVCVCVPLYIDIRKNV